MNEVIKDIDRLSDRKVVHRDYDNMRMARLLGRATPLHEFRRTQEKDDEEKTAEQEACATLEEEMRVIRCNFYASLRESSGIQVSDQGEISHGRGRITDEDRQIRH